MIFFFIKIVAIAPLKKLKSIACTNKPESFCFWKNDKNKIFKEDSLYRQLIQ